MARILVIEDNLTNLRLMQYLLDAFGHVVVSATDGVLGLEALSREPFDVVLCDVLMPEMDGFEFARRYKSDPRNHAPLVAVTALAMVGDRERLLAAGFDGYISKPVDPETFVPQLEPFLNFAPAAAPATPLVLAIDDHQVNIDLVRSWLEPFGYRIVEAHSVQDGLAKAKSTMPDAILCDLHMLDGDGFQMLRAVRSSTELRKVPFFILTSTSWGTSDRLRSLQLGATAFLVRPIEPEELRAHLEAALQKA